jgi:hypothetical protein
MLKDVEAQLLVSNDTVEEQRQRLEHQAKLLDRPLLSKVRLNHYTKLNNYRQSSWTGLYSQKSFKYWVLHSKCTKALTFEIFSQSRPCRIAREGAVTAAQVLSRSYQAPPPTGNPKP